MSNQATKEQVAALMSALSKDDVGVKVLTSAAKSIVAGEDPDAFEFTPSDEQRAKRAVAIGEAKSLAIIIREQVRNAGPSGVRSGTLIVDVVMATGAPMGLVINVASALEVAGYVRLEGTNTVVSEELDPALAASAEPLTISEV